MFDKNKPYALRYPGPFYEQDGVVYFRDGRVKEQPKPLGEMECKCGFVAKSKRGLQMHQAKCHVA